MRSSKRIVHHVATAATITAMVLAGGCVSSGLSHRERPGQSQASYVRALYDNPSAMAAQDGPPAEPQPFRAPAKVAVAQIGEVAPPSSLMEGLRRHPARFARVEALPAVPDRYVDRARVDDAAFATERAVRDHVQALCRMASGMGMDYLLLVGGTIDHETNATPLSILNLTIVGAFVVPSDQTRAHVKASSAMVDLRTRQVISMSSAEQKGGHLTPAVSTREENTQLFLRLTDTVAAKLADQVVADSGGPDLAVAAK